MTQAPNFIDAPAAMRLHNMQTFWSSIHDTLDFERLMAEWQVQAIKDATPHYPNGFRLMSVSHAFWANRLTACFVFEEMA